MKEAGGLSRGTPSARYPKPPGHDAPLADQAPASPATQRRRIRATSHAASERRHGQLRQEPPERGGEPESGDGRGESRYLLTGYSQGYD